MKRLVLALLPTAFGCAYPEFGFTRDDAPIELEDSTTDTALRDDAGLDSAEPFETLEDTYVEDDTALVDSSTDAGRDTMLDDETDASDASETNDTSDTSDTSPVDTAPVFVTLSPRGATWKYLDDGSVPSSAWKGGSSFDDSAWQSGPAKLGYGDTTNATTLEYGPPDAGTAHTTYYFRRSITVSDASSYDQLVISILRDDGAVIYLNGTELARSNMPSGTITPTTFASTAVGGADETTFYTHTASVGALRDGTNVIAVEVHQANLTSSDLGFDMDLRGRKK